MDAIKYHLLKPKVYVVWCTNKIPSVNMNFTNKPSKASCGNCLTRYRNSIGKGKHGKFKIAWTDCHKPISQEPQLQD